MKNKVFKPLLLIASLAVTTISTNVSAAVLDFGTGLAGSGGTITSVGGQVIGADINIGSFEAVGTSNDGVYVVTDGLLNFNTGADTITIDGIISGLGIDSSITLLSGSFDTWSYSDVGSIISFSAGGIDVKNADLLAAVGLASDTAFEFYGFSLGMDSTNPDKVAISTDFVNTSVVPVPAAAWLFGSGIIGLIGVARRKKA